MKPLRFARLSRRDLLRGALAASAAVPLLDATRAQGQGETPTRLLVFATPNGVRNSLYWPSGSETSFTLPSITAPLEGFKDKLLFLRGIRLNDALQNGALGGTVGSEHARGTGGMLTGRPLKSGTDFVSFGNTTSGWGTGQSIDQYIAQQLAPPTTFPSLQVGVHVRDTEVRARVSYAAAEQPIPPREDPADVFDALFANLAPTDGSAEDPALARLRAQRKSVFDITLSETDRLSRLLGAGDRAKLEAHMQYIREIETRLAEAPTGTSATLGSCAAPTMRDVDLNDDDAYLDAGQLQMDLVAAALACDQTRIVTLQWSYSESEHLFQFLGISGNHHAISHDFSQSGTNYDAYNAIQNWYAEQFAYMLGRLDSYQEGDATLLDNTLALWASEIGESTQHDLTLMPYLFAGSAGGRVRPGRFVDWGNTRYDNNQMLVSIAHALGVDDLDAFGDASGGTGPLPDMA
jgi:hypothetical protein